MFTLQPIAELQVLFMHHCFGYFNVDYQDILQSWKPVSIKYTMELKVSIIVEVLLDSLSSTSCLCLIPHYFPDIDTSTSCFLGQVIAQLFKLKAVNNKAEQKMLQIWRMLTEEIEREKEERFNYYKMKATCIFVIFLVNQG